MFYTTCAGYKARVTSSLPENTMQSYVKQHIIIFSFPNRDPIALVLPAKIDAFTQTEGVESIVMEEADEEEEEVDETEEEVEVYETEEEEEMPVLSPYWAHDVPLDLRTSTEGKPCSCCQ